MSTDTNGEFEYSFGDFGGRGRLSAVLWYTEGSLPDGDFYVEAMNLVFFDVHQKALFGKQIDSTALSSNPAAAEDSVKYAVENGVMTFSKQWITFNMPVFPGMIACRTLLL